MTMFKVGDFYEIDITDITVSGEGVGHIEGMTVFCEDAVPGERVRVRISAVKQQYLKGHRAETITPSPCRAQPICSFFGVCGGCSRSHMTYAAQLKYKQKTVEAALSHIAGIDARDYEMIPAQGSPDILRYRNKAQYKVSKEGIGFYEKGSHHVIPIDDCLIEGGDPKVLISALSRWVRESGIAVYDEKTHRGVLRGIAVRTNRKNEKLMTFIVTKKNGFDWKKAVSFHTQAISGLAGITLNINPGRGNRIMGTKSVTLFGSPYLNESLFGLDFRVSPESFFQVNTAQTENLYRRVIDFAELSGDETVYDLYCGTGTIGLCMAEYVKKVVGVEIVAPAVADAVFNAKANGIENAVFYAGKAESLLPECMAKEGVADVIVVDPPRKGCDRSLIDTIIRSGANRVVYVSCDPATLARDVGRLNAGGYDLKRVQAFDMFPQTGHVETVVLLSRVK